MPKKAIPTTVLPTLNPLFDDLTLEQYRALVDYLWSQRIVNRRTFVNWRQNVGLPVAE